MSYVWDFVINGLAEIAAFLLGILLGWLWGWLRNTSPARSFWRLGPAERVHVATSMPLFREAEERVYIPSGDALAYSEISAFLRRHYREAKITFQRNPKQPISDWNHTLILIGGGKNNLTARCLLAALNPPMCSRDHKHPPYYDHKGLVNREDEPMHLGPVHTEYAYVIRAPNPFNRSKQVFIIIGRHTRGTYGAALWATEPKNLAWLRWQCRWQRVKEIFGRQHKTDSLQVVLLVLATSQSSSAEIPFIGEIEVWHQDGGRRPYYFCAPKPIEYAEAYNQWCSQVGAIHG